MIPMLRRHLLKSHKVHLISSPGKWHTYVSVVTELRADSGPTFLCGWKISTKLFKCSLCTIFVKLCENSVLNNI